ncbi:MAG: phage terminase large subunit [Bacteroidota bacterium]
MPVFRVKLNPFQSLFRHSKKPYRGYCAGRGSGKTWAGAYDLIMQATSEEGRGFRYSVISPTYKILSETTLLAFLDLGRELGAFHQSDFRRTPYPSVMLSGGSTVVFRSGEDPESLRGPNYGGIWLDEASLMVKDVFDIAIASLRQKPSWNWLTATFTPKGRQHWTYHKFGNKSDPDVGLVQAPTSANFALPRDFESKVRSQYTSNFARQELSGEFVDLDGGQVQREWFPIVEQSQSVVRRVRAWDKASTEDGGCYTAGVLIGKSDSGLYYVEHVVRGQLSSHARNELIKQTAAADKAKYGTVETLVEQEPGSGGKESAEFTIKELAGYPVYSERPTGNKEVRFQPFAAQAEAGNIRLVNGHWNSDYLDELVAFPASEFKDQADATSGAFNRLALVNKKKFFMYA